MQNRTAIAIVIYLSLAISRPVKAVNVRSNAILRREEKAAGGRGTEESRRRREERRTGKRDNDNPGIKNPNDVYIFLLDLKGQRTGYGASSESLFHIQGKGKNPNMRSLSLASR